MYPTIHLPLCPFIICMSPCNIYPLFPFWVKKCSMCNYHTFSLCFSLFFMVIFLILCLHVFCVFVLFCFVLLCYSLSIPHILFLLLGQKLLRLFSSKVYCLCLTACVCCILALWAPSTSLLFSVCSKADTPLYIPSLSTCILTVLLLIY